ncbi:hypothetical protein [Thiomicrorhabdus hydrogeniphila]
MPFYNAICFMNSRKLIAISEVFTFFLNLPGLVSLFYYQNDRNILC